MTKSLYCGITTDLSTRELQHNNGKGSAYVHSRGGGKIIYSEKLNTRGEALKREAEVKKLPRARKFQLIYQSQNLNDTKKEKTQVLKP